MSRLSKSIEHSWKRMSPKATILHDLTAQDPETDTHRSFNANFDIQVRFKVMLTAETTQT